METKNGEKPAFSYTDGVTFAWDGLTKREYTCIKLGIPDTGDSELDDLIRKSERKRLAESAMQGVLSHNHPANPTPNQAEEIVKYAIGLADELLKQLEK